MTATFPAPRSHVCSAALALALSLGCQAPTNGHNAGTNDGAKTPGARKAETQWVDPGSLRQSPIQHDSLTPSQVDRITKLHAVFAEVDPTPLEKWFEDFRRDRDPDREIAIYEGMAAAFVAYSDGRSLTPEQKADAYQVVLLRSAAPDHEVLERVSLEALTVADVKQILSVYEAPPVPVTVVADTTNP